MKNIIGAVFSVTAAFALTWDASAAFSTYTNENAFKAASGAGPTSLNTFTDVTLRDSIPALVYGGSPANAGYRIATGGFGPGATPNNVWSILDGGGKCVGISVDDTGDLSLQIDMLGNKAAKAVGGKFFNTDQNGDFQDAWLTFKLSDGTSTTNRAVSTDAFFGFASSDPNAYITQVKVFNRDSTSGIYPTVSYLYVVGSVPVPVPEPSVVITNLAVLLSAGMGAVYYRRRNAKRG